MPANRNYLRVGAFVSLALATIAILIVYFSKGALSLAPHIRVYLIADSVGGLTDGAKVLMSGVSVGHVEGTELADGGRKVRVSLRILTRNPIPTNSLFSIEQAGFLGDQFVAISVPTNASPVAVQDGAVVISEPPFNLQEAARTAMSFVHKLDAAVERVNSAVDRVDKTLLTDQTLTNLAVSAENVRNVTGHADAGVLEFRAFFATNGPAVSGVLSNLGHLTQTLGSAATNIEARIADSKPTLDAALANISDASGSLKRILAGLEAGKGAAGAALSDDGLRLTVGDAVTNLAVLSSNLAHFGILYHPRQPHTFTNRAAFPAPKF